jgi:hypothetical protein
MHAHGEITHLHKIMLTPVFLGIATLATKPVVPIFHERSRKRGMHSM